MIRRHRRLCMSLFEIRIVPHHFPNTGREDRMATVAVGDSVAAAIDRRLQVTWLV